LIIWAELTSQASQRFWRYPDPAFVTHQAIFNNRELSELTVHIHPDIAHHKHAPSMIDMGNRWDGTTLTDTRSRRSRTSRRGGQLLTRAHSPLGKNGLPIRVPRRPLFRTVTPYARLETPGEQNNTRTLASFHTGYQRNRVDQLPAAQGHQNPRTLPDRRRAGEAALPRLPRHGPHHPSRPRRPLQLQLESRPQPVRPLYSPAASTGPNINTRPRAYTKVLTPTIPGSAAGHRLRPPRIDLPWQGILPEAAIDAADNRPHRTSTAVALSGRTLLWFIARPCPCSQSLARRFPQLPHDQPARARPSTGRHSVGPRSFKSACASSIRSSMSRRCRGFDNPRCGLARNDPVPRGLAIVPLWP
jgi:hypothetical protein